MVSSDTMKISSKSSPLPVPVRSRRLRTSGSVKGGKASPMFRVVENPEPSSPKVSCIGQVRVKKNNRNGRRSGSRRRSHEIIKRVHLPLTIFEALRDFKADFNCFASEREKVEKPGISSSCTTLMVELMAENGGGRKGSQRRQLFEGIEFKEGTGFESFCIPPKNALLSMRCRSDPVKMAALAKRLLETSETGIEDEKEEDDENMHKITLEEIFKLKQDINGDKDEKYEYPDEENAVENGGKSLVIDDEEEEIQNQESKKRESRNSKLERESSVIPDCLVLMMYEPKLSMEVSKETWVCSTDFIRWSPATEKKKKQAGKTNHSDEPTKLIGDDDKPPARTNGFRKPPTTEEEKKKQVCKINDSEEPTKRSGNDDHSPARTDGFRQPKTTEEKKKQVCKINDSDEPTKHSGNEDNSPARTDRFRRSLESSCSFPATTVASMVLLIEQKLAMSKAREPFALSRCQSEPRKSAAKLAPDSFFFKGSKVEPYC